MKIIERNLKNLNLKTINDENQKIKLKKYLKKY
jgi:hypothetical protein